MRILRPTNLILYLSFALLMLLLSRLPADGDAAPAATPELIHPDPARILVSNGTHLFAGRSDVGNDAGPDPCPQLLPVIRRMNLDGSNPLTLFEACPFLLKAMAADALHVYYLYNEDIYRVSVSGGTPEAVVIDQASTSLALDDEYLYWGDSTPDSSTIYRRHKSTGVQETLVTLPDPLQMRVRDLAVDDSHVYWVMGNLGVGEVRRVPKAGGASMVLADTADGLNFPRYISLDATHVYWSEDFAAQVRRVPKTGGSVTTYTAPDLANESNLSAVAVGDSHIFWWWDGWGVGPGRIRRAAKAGGPIEDIVFDVDWSGTVLVEAGSVYWSQNDEGILRLPGDAAPVSIDLTLDEIEVTQGLQNLTGVPVPLVAQKDTYVRAYPRADYPFIENVSAVLRAFGPGDVPLGEVDPLTPSLVVGLEWERRLLDDGFTFQLPEDWTDAGSVELCVEINPDQPIPELDTDNNVGCEWAIFEAKRPLCLVLVPVDATGTPFVPTPSEVDGWTLQALRTLWPSPVTHRGDAVLSWYGEPFDLPERGTELLNLLEFKLSHNHFPADFCPNGRIHMAGVVHGSADTEGVGGQGRSPGSVVWYKRVEIAPIIFGNLYEERYGLTIPIINWPFAPLILAHELGHNYGRRHIDCGGPPPDDPIDQDYPFYPCSFTERPGPLDPSPVPTDGEYGFYPGALNAAELTRNWTLIDPGDWVAPLMSYGEPQWISEHTYSAIFNAIPGAFTPLQGTPAPFTESDTYTLMLFTEGNEGASASFYAMPETLFGADKLDELHARHLALLDPGSPYTVRLIDGGGALIVEYQFRLPITYDGGGDNSAVFPFPMSDGVSTIQVEGPDGLLVEQQVSANAPTVTVISPNGGEDVDDDMVVQWQATDVDGDDLTFTIQYSPDGGQSWQVIVTETDGEGAPPDFAHTLTAEELEVIAGSVGAAHVRVIASDGANRGWDESDRPFSLELKHPTVAILSPRDEEMLAFGKELIFTGWAYDAEDGELGDSALSWRLDGQPIGTGRKISVTGLEPGEHILNLKGTDSDGMEGEDRVRFFVSGGSCPLFNREVDILFLIDSSSVMNDIPAVEQAVGDAVSWLQDAGMDVVSENYCVSAGSCAGPVVADVHPGTEVDHPADWGAGIASLAAHYDWREESTRIIVPISNQAPEDGGPVQDPGPDRDALETAIAAANDSGVAVAPLILPGPNGQEPPVALQALAYELATRTGAVPADDPDGLGPLLHGVMSNVGCQPRVRDISVPASIAENGEPGRIFVRGESLWPGTQFWLGEQELPLGEESIYGRGLSLHVPGDLAGGCHDLVLNRPGVGERTVSCAVFVQEGVPSVYLPIVMMASD